MAILKANASLAAVVGVQFSALMAPSEFTGVWVTVKKISHNEESAHDGHQGLTRQRWQFDIGSMTKELCDRVSDILCTEFNGANYSAFVGTTEEQEITFFQEDCSESWEESPRHYMASVDLMLISETT